MQPSSFEHPLDRRASPDLAETPGRERRSLAIQALLGWAAFFVIGPAVVAYMRYVRRHRVEGLEEARRAYRQAMATGRPTLVCANHLTMVDSVFLHATFASIGEYLTDFRRFSWNVPAVENFARNPFLRALVYLGKCLPIDRAGDAAHHRGVLDKIAFLVARGEVCTIFPEGGRSRTGRVEVEHVTYGVGRVLGALDRPQVVCAYLRGERQDGYSDLPVPGDVLRLRVAVIEPRTDLRGLRGARELARQVIVKLRDMEDEYFSEAPVRASGDGGRQR